MKSITLISGDMVCAKTAEKLLRELYRVETFSDAAGALDQMHLSVPDLIVADLESNTDDTMSILSVMKNDPMMSRIPVLAIVEFYFSCSPSECLIMDDYIRRTCVREELLNRVELCLRRVSEASDISGLSYLPGLNSIVTEIDGRLADHEMFAVGYVTIPGFAEFVAMRDHDSGTEVLRMATRLLVNTIKAHASNIFVGHIVDDRFVFVSDIEGAAAASEKIIESFDAIVGSFYEDQGTGAFCPGCPRMALNIGITHVRQRKFTTSTEMIKAAAQAVGALKESAAASAFRIAAIADVADDRPGRQKGLKVVRKQRTT